MQRLSILSSLFVASVAGFTLPSAANAQGLGGVLALPCTNASFNGNYVFKYSGYVGTGSAVPFGTVGRFVVDGNGNGDAYKVTVVNGAGAPPGETEDQFTYSASADCVMKLSTNVGEIDIEFEPPTALDPFVSVGYAIVVPDPSVPNGAGISTIVGEVRRLP